MVPDIKGSVQCSNLLLHWIVQDVLLALQPHPVHCIGNYKLRLEQQIELHRIPTMRRKPVLYENSSLLEFAMAQKRGGRIANGYAEVIFDRK
jgi:hypothetical protein